jgi:hypothetical protein
MNGELLLDTGLTLLHILAGVGILRLMHLRGCTGAERYFWSLAAVGTFARPLSLLWAVPGKSLELAGVTLFVTVLFAFSRPIQKTTRTEAEVATGLAREARLTAEISTLKAFIRGFPVAGGTFTAPTDDGAGLNFIWGTEHWFPFHGIEDLSVEDGVGTAHYALNPEVARSAVFRAVHRRVSAGGPPEGDDRDTFRSKPLAWRAWPGPDGGVSMAALHIPEGAMPAQRPPEEVRATQAAVTNMLQRWEASYVP